MLTSALGPQGHLSGHSARSKHITLCRLYSWTKGNFMMRNHSMAAVPGQSDVLITSMDLVFSKSSVLFFLHHQDTVSYYNSRTLSYQVLKQCTALTETWISYVKSTGMRVNTGYINSTTGTSSNKGIMRFYIHRNQREVGGQEFHI